MTDVQQERPLEDREGPVSGAEAGESGPPGTPERGDPKRNGSRLGTPVTGSKPRSLLSNAVWNVSSTLWLMAVALFMTPFLISHIGTSHYGLFMLLFAISGVMDVMGLGLAEATLYYVAYYYGRNDLAGIRRVVGSTLSVYVTMGLIGWAGVFFGAPLLADWLAVPPEDKVLALSVIRLTSINFGLVFVSGVFNSVPQALRRYDISTLVRVAQSLFYVLGTVVVVLKGGDVHGLVLWSLATSLFMLLLAMLWAKLLIPGLPLLPAPSRAGLREVFGYGVFMFVSHICSIAGRYVDRLLLAFMVDTSSVAYLTVPENISSRAHRVALEGGWVLFPRISATSREDHIRGLYVASTWALLCMTAVMFVPIGVLIPDFLRLWIKTPPDFARHASFIGQLLAAGYLVRGAFVSHETLFRGIRKPGYVAGLSIASSLTAVAANLILIWKYGLVGAGYAFCITAVWGLVGILVAWRWVLKMRSVWPMVRVVGLPMVLGYAGFVFFHKLRLAMLGPIGWSGLLGLAVLLFAAMGVLLVGVEWLLGGPDNQVSVFLRYVVDLRNRQRAARAAG
jgi:O-antigen/teichoic acid export membrane protein